MITPLFGKKRRQTMMARAKKRKNPSSAVAGNNPLLRKQRAFLETALTAAERDGFFGARAVAPGRRAELWAAQADLGERLVNEHAWATPNDRALRVLRHFAPIVEMGCGANAYWCRQMKAVGVDVMGYDVAPDKGGTIEADRGASINSNRKQQTDFPVQQGGPQVLSKHSDRTLFLCYPDEHAMIDEETSEPISMAAECLKHYQGEYIIHVGELFTTGCLSLEQPWGRSSSAEFQERLASEFHCLLCIELPNWLHTVDRLTVWKRSPTTTIVFAGESDDDESDEEVEYRHVPVEERLPVDVAAPCLQHLLTDNNAPIAQTTNKEMKEAKPPVSASKKKTKKKQEKSGHSNSKPDAKNPPPEGETSEHNCPW